MALPKSVVKINKKGLKFTSNVERTKYTLEELSRAALKDVAKLLRKKIKAIIPVDEGVLKKNLGTWVRRSKNKKDQPTLQVGFYDRKRANKKGYKYAYHQHLVLFGTKASEGHHATQANNVLKKITEESIDDIRRIQGKYLSAIENENRALGLIDEREEVKDD